MNRHGSMIRWGEPILSLVVGLPNYGPPKLCLHVFALGIVQILFEVDAFQMGILFDSWAAWLSLRRGNLLVKSTIFISAIMSHTFRPITSTWLFGSFFLSPPAPCSSLLPTWPCSAGFSGPGCLACRGRCPVQNHRGGLVGRIPAVAPQWVRLHLRLWWWIGQDLGCHFWQLQKDFVTSHCSCDAGGPQYRWESDRLREEARRCLCQQLLC